MPRGNSKPDALARVIARAGEALLHEPGEIRISSIAAKAQCSTATIYEIYGSKENLLDDALSRLLLDWPAPSPSSDRTEPFGALLAYAAARIEYFNSDHTRRLFVALRRRGERGAVIARGLMLKRASFHKLVDLVSAAAAQGRICANDPEAVAYLISSGTALEPIMAADLFGVGSCVDKAAILRKVFAAFVIDEGVEQLAAFLAACPPRPALAEHRLPLAADYRGDEASDACPRFVRRTLISLGVASPSISVQ